MENNSPLEAYSYMFKDNKFWIKYLVLLVMTIICIIPSLITGDPTQQANNTHSLGILPLLCFVVNVFFNGYICAGIKSLSEQNSNYLLPFFNFKTHGIIGIKWLAASLLFGLALFIILFVLGILFAIIFALSKLLGIILTAIAILTAILLIGIYSAAFFRMFAVTQDVFAFFRFKEIFKSVADNAKNYFKYIGACYGIGCLYLLVLILFAILLPFKPNELTFNIIMGGVLSVCGAYLNIAYMYICAKCIK